VTDEVQISGNVSFSREYFRFESPSISDFQGFSWMEWILEKRNENNGSFPFKRLFAVFQAWD